MSCSFRSRRRRPQVGAHPHPMLCDEAAWVSGNESFLRGYAKTPKM
jgi:hypothetical protein